MSPSRCRQRAVDIVGSTAGLGVRCDDRVGERCEGVRRCCKAPLPPAELPETVHAVSIAVPLLYKPPPMPVAELPAMVSLVRLSVSGPPSS